MKTKNLDKLITYPIITIVVIIMAICFVGSVIIVFLFSVPFILFFWVKKIFIQIFEDHPLVIQGEVLETKEVDEDLFFYNFSFNYNMNEINYFYPAVKIHRYLVMVKNNIGVNIVRVSRDVFLKIKKEERISMVCTKNQMDGVYEIYS